MALALCLSLAGAVLLIPFVHALIPLLPLLSFQPCAKLRFPPNKLSRVQIITVIAFLSLKSSLKQLGLVPSLRPSRVSASPARNGNAFHLPDLRLGMPVVVNRADMESYERATCAPNTASPTSGANSLFLLSPVTEPLMLLLLARPVCPILPLGSVNVRNRFDFISPGECKNVSLRTRLRAEASLRRKGRRVKRGVEFDVAIEVFGEDTGELIFRQVMTILQFLDRMVEPIWHESPQMESNDLYSLPDDAYRITSEEMLTIQQEAPSAWAALCKDYNPTHISATAARLLGFPGRIAHGNQAAAMMVERLASTPGSSIRNLWLDSNMPSFMVVAFRRPMVVPMQLLVKTTDDATQQRSKRSDEALVMSHKQITAWAAEAGLPDNIRRVAKAHYKRVYSMDAFKGKRQDAIMAGCIFIACRDCNTPRTFSEIYSFTHVPKKEIGTVYKTLERFLSSTLDETLHHFRLYGRGKVYVEGRVGWLGQNSALQE
jgi:acyl dehydratase